MDLYEEASEEPESADPKSVRQTNALLTLLADIPFFLFGYIPFIFIFCRTNSNGNNIDYVDELFGGISETWDTCFTPLIYGLITGSCVGWYFIDEFGRKIVLLNTSLLLLLLFLFNFVRLALIPERAIFNAYVASKFLDKIVIYIIGVCICVLMNSFNIYIAEVATLRNRGNQIGWANSSIILGILSGILLTSFIRFFHDKGSHIEHSISDSIWVYYALPLGVLALLSVGVLIIPDSPAWLMMRRSPAGICFEYLYLVEIIYCRMHRIPSVS